MFERAPILTRMSTKEPAGVDTGGFFDVVSASNYDALIYAADAAGGVWL